MTQPPIYLSTGQAARELGVSPSAINLWAKEGLFDYHLTPGGHRRFKQSEVMALRSQRDDKKRAAAVQKQAEKERIEKRGKRVRKVQ